jgi:hypothetical protein
MPILSRLKGTERERVVERERGKRRREKERGDKER